MSGHTERSMADEKPKKPTPKPVSQLADDEPDPTVQPPALVWISKGYKSETPGPDGAEAADEEPPTR